MTSARTAVARASTSRSTCSHGPRRRSFSRTRRARTASGARRRSACASCAPTSRWGSTTSSSTSARPSTRSTRRSGSAGSSSLSCTRRCRDDQQRNGNEARRGRALRRLPRRRRRGDAGADGRRRRGALPGSGHVPRPGRGPALHGLLGRAPARSRLPYPPDDRRRGRGGRDLGRVGDDGRGQAVGEPRRGRDPGAGRQDRVAAREQRREPRLRALPALRAARPRGWWRRMNRYDLQGRVSIDSGASVVLAARRAERLRRLARDLQARYGVRALAVRTDVTREDDVVRLVALTVERFGAVDVLVNNAGVYVAKPLVEQTLDDWRTVLDVNLTSAFLACREAAKVMVPRRSGS